MKNTKNTNTQSDAKRHAPELTQVAFLESIDQLNPAQRKAVEQIEGPVLVIAGPGTGKTQILAARVGNILLETDAQPGNIMCLTYTEAGAIAMRNRLKTFVGQAAYDVHIHTFHGFCNQVIQENPEYFGLQDMEPISELEEIQLLEKLFDTFGDKHPLKRWRGKIYFDIHEKRIQRLFSTMKKENWSAQDIHEAVEQMREELPTRATYQYSKKYKDNKAGDPNWNKISKVLDPLEKTVAAAGEFDRYQQMKREKGRYDFDDMIYDVLRAFKENETLLLRYQERFHYFLVDEFQDTSGAQNELLYQLISYWNMPNIFVVGDDDQSIYRFQGANMENILDFYKRVMANLPQEEQLHRTIVLTENYRSTPAILQMAAANISQNEHRLVNILDHLHLDKNLVAKNPDTAAVKENPTIVCYYNEIHEVIDVADQIEDLHKKGASLNDIAILFRKHAQGEALLHVLNQKKIPVRTRRQVNVLHESLTRMLLTILEYIYEENRIPHSREDLLFRIMHFPFWGIRSLSVSRLAFELREARYKKPKITWRDMLNMPTIAIDMEDKQKLMSLSQTIEKWMTDYHHVPLQLLFQRILDGANVLKYVMQHEEKIWLLQELTTFYNFIKTESAKKPQIDVREILGTIRTMNAYALSLSMMRISYAEQAVTLSTVHSAKGLEYKHVFLVGCTASKWDTSTPSREYKLPEGLFYQDKEDQQLEEVRRLFYVALTRAKHSLQLSYAQKNRDGKEQDVSRLVYEVKEWADWKERYVSDYKILDYGNIFLQEETIHAPEIIESQLLRERIEKYKLSVTHLNNYLYCPLKFYYQNLLQIPQAKNAAMAFGSVIHKALELLFKQMKENDETFPPKEQLVNMAEWAMHKHADSFTEKEYKQRMEYLQRFLPLYYDRYIHQWNRIVNFERVLEGTYKGIPIKGMIDKMEFVGNKTTIVDYKTGQYSNAKKKLVKPAIGKEGDLSYNEQYGGDYWRQAVFYALLIDYNKDLGRAHWRLNGVEFDFVEPDSSTQSFQKHTMVISEEEKAIVKQQIEDTWNNIHALKFDGCGRSECEWCTFEKEYKRN